MGRKDKTFRVFYHLLSLAAVPQRAGRTARSFGRADDSAQLHQGLVKVSWPLGVHSHVGQGPMGEGD